MIENVQDRTIAMFPEPPLLIKPGTFKGTPAQLRKLILQQIEDYPEHFEMDSWVDGDRVSDMSPDDRRARLEALDGVQGCGTTMCMAGYAQLMVEGKITDDIEEVAARAMGVHASLFYRGGNTEARAELRDLVREDERQAAREAAQV